MKYRNLVASLSAHAKLSLYFPQRVLPKKKEFPPPRHRKDGGYSTVYSVHIVHEKASWIQLKLRALLIVVTSHSAVGSERRPANSQCWQTIDTTTINANCNDDYFWVNSWVTTDCFSYHLQLHRLSAPMTAPRRGLWLWIWCNAQVVILLSSRLHTTVHTLRCLHQKPRLTLCTVDYSRLGSGLRSAGMAVKTLAPFTYLCFIKSS